MTVETKKEAQRRRYQKWLERHPEKRAQINEKARQWRLNNPERQKAAVRLWQHANPDKVCAGAARYRSSHKDEVAASLAEWRNKNRDHIREYNKAKRAARTEQDKECERTKERSSRQILRARNRETYNARLREWSQNNPEKIKERNNRWKNGNPDKVRTLRIRRRAPSGERPFTHETIAEIRRLQKNKCGYCRESLARTFHVDHITALARGGTNDRRNIQLLCPTCNRRKHKRDPIEFAQAMGMLL